MFRSRDPSGNIRYIGRSKATVLDIKDPLKKGRIRIQHPLLGSTTWIDYLKLPNHFDVPSIGDIVYVECDCGDHEHPIAWGNVTKGYPDSIDLPAVFRRHIPTNRGMYTPGGQLFEMDDGEANDVGQTAVSRGIRLSTKNGTYKIHIADDPSGTADSQYILLESSNGSRIKINDETNAIEIISTQGSLYISTETDVTILAGGNTTVNSTGIVEVNGSQIRLNGTAGDVLTTTTDPVIDTIFGAPTTGVTTVKSG